MPKTTEEKIKQLGQSSTPEGGAPVGEDQTSVEEITRDLSIQMMPIDAVKPYFKNPRINDEGVEKVQQSIQQFGTLQPLVVDKDLTIVVGHTRYKALKRLGWKEIPVVVAEHLTPDQARAYRIADNATRDWSTWDTALLAEELRTLDDNLSPLMKSVLTMNVDELLGDSVGQAQSSAPPTQEKIDEKQEEMDGQMQDRGGKQQEESMRDVRCPHCGQEFLIDIK